MRDLVKGNGLHFLAVFAKPRHARSRHSGRTHYLFVRLCFLAAIALLSRDRSGRPSPGRKRAFARGGGGIGPRPGHRR